MKLNWFFLQRSNKVIICSQMAEKIWDLRSKVCTFKVLRIMDLLQIAMKLEVKADMNLLHTGVRT